jgi:Flp pilus assembly protein TadG
MNSDEARQMLFAKRMTFALWRSLHRLAGRTLDDCQGVAAIEFAIVGPMLVVMMICTVDLGTGIFRRMQVQNAAQAGAIYAALHGFTASSISTAVTSATNFSGISASPAPATFCGCASGNAISTISCSSTCTGGGSPGTYVTVSAQATYTPILSYPYLPDSFTFNSQSTVRIQ